MNVKKFIISEAHVFSEKMWTGGIFDVLFLGKDQKIYIGDFKSSKEAYLSQFLQIGGYHIQLEENGAFTEKGERLLEPVTAMGYYVFPFSGGR